MTSFRFEDFRLDPTDRRLCRGEAPVELNARYLDALALLVREQGRLVSKDRFLDEVWRGVPVTDEALTQCIKTLRRQLGDEAGRPRFIETVPKHGYRFIAPVETIGAGPEAEPTSVAPPKPGFSWRQFLLVGGAGALGGGVAGFFGGLIYGFAGASQPLQPGVGAISVLLVLMWLTIIAGLTGGAGVAFGIAASGFVRRPGPWTVVGGAAGGMILGAFAKLLGLDAFTLLFGHSPGDITGGLEGLLLGGAVGVGAWFGSRGTTPRLRLSMAAAGMAGGLVGLIIPWLGGRLMGGSLDLLARAFPDSHLRFDRIGGLFGESGFGPVSQAATGVLEGVLFCSCVAGAMVLARRSLSRGG